MAMIKLKKSELDSVHRFLDKLKLNKIYNSDVRKIILRVLLDTKKQIEVMQTEVEAIRKKFFSEFSKEDINKFQDIVNNISTLISEQRQEEALELDKNTTEKYPDLVVAYKGFTEAIKELQSEEIEINVEPIGLDEFVVAMSDQTVDITGKTLDMLNMLFKNDSEN